MQYIPFLPDLGGIVQVTMGVHFDPTSQSVPNVLTNFADPKSFNATYKWPSRDGRTNLRIIATLAIPPDPSKILHIHQNTPSFHTVEGRFDNVFMRDGKLLFTNSDTIIQGNPNHPGDAARSRIRFIYGHAWRAKSDNPSIHVIKIRLYLGSEDVELKSVNVKEESPGISNEVGGSGGGKTKIDIPGPAGWVLDPVEVDIKVDFKSKFTSGGKVTERKDVRLLDRAMQFREWQLSLEEPMPKPKLPTTVSLAHQHKVYFLTNKSDWNGVNNSPNQMPNKKDQFKELQLFVSGLSGDIDRIEVIGHASRLSPDTAKNFTLSENRAKYVKELFSRMLQSHARYKNLKSLPPIKAYGLGEPVTPGNDKDNDPEHLRVDVHVYTKK